MPEGTVQSTATVGQTPESRLADWWLGRAGAMLCTLIGVSVLLGWIFELETLKSVIPGAVQMKANTAVGLILSGLASLLLASHPTPTRRLTAQFLGSVVTLIGATTLGEYLFGWQLGIDQMLFHDHANAYNALPGRMSPYSATVFVAIGAALTLLSRHRARIVVLACAILTSAIGLLSALGYLWNASELITDQWLPPVAINTAVAFIGLGVSMVYAHHLWTRRLLAASESHSLVETKLVVAFTAALVLFCLGGGITYQLAVKYTSTVKLLTQSQQVRSQLDELYAADSDAQINARYLLLGADGASREEYADAARRTHIIGEQLEQLVATEPEQRARLIRIRSLVDRRLQLLAHEIQVLDRDGAAAARSEAVRDGSADVASLLRIAIQQMNNDEAARSTLQSANLARQRGYTLLALLITLITASATLIAMFGSIARDIRERARITRELDAAERKAQLATRAKSDFLAAMSHEIRTPMNGVLGMIDVLQQSSLLGTQQEMVSLMRESAESLLTIIDDILDFSKIEAGHLQIEQVPFSPREVVEKTCNMLNRLAERKGVMLHVFVDPATPAAVLGDSGRVRQVLINLTNNAIKFSSGLPRPGRVWVRATAVAAAAGHEGIQFSVADNGIGMNEETRGKLFTPFTQADVSTTRRYGGTGLGLTISRHLIGLMGGTIEVQSAPGEGARFIAQLSFSKTIVPPDLAEPDSPITGLRCVVSGPALDTTDEPLVADLIRYLHAGGAHADSLAFSGALDSQLPARSADVVLWLLDPQSAGATPNLPASNRLVIIVLDPRRGGFRGMVSEATRYRLLDGNALTRQAFYEAIAIAAGRLPTAGDASSNAHRAEPPRAPSRAEAVQTRQLILVAEDNEINQRVLRQQLSMLGYAADFAGTGREALEMLHSGDYALLLTDLHMPQLDGYELVARIRRGEASAHTRLPVIALTANALSGEAERCRVAGMDGYLSKPTSMAQLQEVLSKWLSTGQAAATLKAMPVDISELQALVGPDENVIEELLGEFSRMTAQVAAELIDAASSHRIAEIAELGHKLKSSSRAVGALQLGTLCENLERAANSSDQVAITALLPEFISELAAVNDFLQARQRRVQQTQGDQLD